MFIVAKRNIVVPSNDGKESYFIPKGYIGNVPEWVGDTKYFEELVMDCKISISESKKDKDIEKAEETPVIDHAKEEKAEDAPKKKMSKVKVTY
ncbi:MAG: hypothetical protein SOY97_04755 [Candidatus Metalachnospira sp.]|nr:hypothetical protein [Candidatus Metalachnospira sp.]